MRRLLYVPLSKGHRWRFQAGLFALALLLVLVGGALARAVGDEARLTLTIPLGSERSLLLMAATRALPDELGGTRVTFYDLRLRVGRGDRLHETYEQLLDETLPLWPPWP